MDISDSLLCLFSARINDQRDTYTIEVPRREVESGALEPGETYRIALIEDTAPQVTQDEQPTTGPQPPVEIGETRYVEIEDLGDQGDGIARVERGYVIIVPGAEIGDRVKIEIQDVKSNFAVGEVIDQ